MKTKYNKKKKDDEYSVCCASKTYQAPKYYATKMNDIPDVTVCIHCGCECNTYTI